MCVTRSPGMIALGFITLTVEELLSARECGMVLPERTAVITFDDGLADFAAFSDEPNRGGRPGAAGTDGRLTGRRWHERVTLATPADGSTGGCMPIAAPLAQAILAKPGGYYVNVHTATEPQGAIRGTLSK